MPLNLLEATPLGTAILLRNILYISYTYKNTLLGHIAGSMSPSVDGNQLVMWLKPHNQCAKKCWTGRDRKTALGIHLTSKLDVGIQSNNSKDNCGQHSNQDVGAGHPSQIKNIALGIHIPLYAMPSLTTYTVKLPGSH